MPRSTQPTRSTWGDLNSDEEVIGQDRTVTMKVDGPAEESLDMVAPENIDLVSTEFNEKAKLLQFMEEEVTVLVHETTNPDDEQMPFVANDGITQYFERGKPMIVKRKYVEVLARLKKVAYSNQRYKLPTGDDAYRYPSQTALLYPFSVLEDSDRGKAWLRNTLAEG